jgi:hypothetical protein
MHRREIKDKKKSQINDTFFAESYKNAKYAKVFPSRFAIMPDMTTKKYSQNMMKGGSRNLMRPPLSVPKAFPQIISRKWTGMRTVSSSVLEKRLSFIKNVYTKILTTTSLRIRRNFES